MLWRTRVGQAAGGPRTTSCWSTTHVADARQPLMCADWAAGVDKQSRDLGMLVKLCTYHHWFGRPSDLPFELYYELPMGISALRTLVQFRLGSHTLPAEQGRFARPAVPRHLCWCTVCDLQAVGDELHCVFDCPHFNDTKAQFPGLFRDAAGVHASAHVAQGPGVCLPLSHCLAAEGSDMNTIPSS